MDTSARPPPSEERPAYVYAASDIRPRQAREIELCKRASDFDWRYTGAMAVGFVGAEYVSLGYLKSQEQPGLRLAGPAVIGFFWGGLLSGGYLSLPKCDPLWAYGAPPEGNVRTTWPMAAAITMLSSVTAPFMDSTFLGAVPVHWSIAERRGRLFVAMGGGAIGSLFPYVLSPRTWAAKKEIERIRIGEVAGGPFLSYTRAF